MTFKHPSTLILALLLGATATVAQTSQTGSIAGRVTPPHDHPFTLATARIPDLGLRAEVGGDGTFRFDDVPPAPT